MTWYVSLKAACGNDLADWYGKFSVSWEGEGTPETSLRYWLDPDNLGVTAIDTLTNRQSSKSSKKSKTSKSGKSGKSSKGSKNGSNQAMNVFGREVESMSFLFV